MESNEIFELMRKQRIFIKDLSKKHKKFDF